MSHKYRWLVNGIVVMLVVFFCMAIYHYVSKSRHGGRAFQVVLRIPSRGEFEYTFTNPICDTDQIGALKSQLTQTVRKQLGWKPATGDPSRADANDAASETLHIDFTGYKATITIAAKNAADAQAQFEKITAVMTTVFTKPLAFTISDSAMGYQSSRSMREDVRCILESRVSPDGALKVRSHFVGDDEIVLNFFGVNDTEHVKKMLLADGHIAIALLPNRIDATENASQSETLLYDHVLKKHVLLPEALRSSVTILEGKDFAPNSHMEYDAQGKPEIAFTIKGATNQQHFGAMTAGNIGRTLVIVVGSGSNERVVSAPTIRGRIDRSGVITGKFTPEQAMDMAALLNAGTLPVPVELVDSRMVDYQVEVK